MGSLKLMSTWAVALALLVALTACGGGDEGAGGRAAKQEMTVNWGTEPPSLDPGLATDTTSSNILLNIMDPLVKLGRDLLRASAEPRRSWDLSGNSRTVTFHLRPDGRWTNGDLVTAQDFAYSWKRTLSSELSKPRLPVLRNRRRAGVRVHEGCAALRDRVGIRALNAGTLRVQLTSAQPWFVQQAAHHSFLAVHRLTVERFGAEWTEAANIVRTAPSSSPPGSTTRASTWSSGPSGGTPQRRAPARQRLDADGRDACASGVRRGRRGRHREPAAVRHPAAEGDAGVQPVSGPRDLLLRRQPEERPRSQPAGEPCRSRSIAARSSTITQAGRSSATGFVPAGMPGFDAINAESSGCPKRLTSSAPRS